MSDLSPLSQTSIVSDIVSGTRCILSQTDTVYSGRILVFLNGCKTSEAFQVYLYSYAVPQCLIGQYINSIPFCTHSTKSDNLALEYCRVARSSGRFRAIFWIDAYLLPIQCLKLPAPRLKAMIELHLSLVYKHQVVEPFDFESLTRNPNDTWPKKR